MKRIIQRHTNETRPHVFNLSLRENKRYNLINLKP